MTPSTPVLSVLDPSPVFEGRTARSALTESRALALALDDSSYRAYWVQEHHNATSFAGTAPEILMADLASRTRRLVLGSGGIMLPNYSPLKVAEWGQTLNQLYPGRIEIGLGRATGADPRASAALLGPGAHAFPTMMTLLLDWLRDAAGDKPIGSDHRAHSISAHPPGPHPDIWLLCASPDSARFAGTLGLKMAFADFLNPGGARPALKAYRAAFRPSVFSSEPYTAIGLTVLAAETESRAHQLAAPVTAWAMRRQTIGFTAFQDRFTAQAELDRAGQMLPRRGVIGTAAQIAAHLMDLHQQTAMEEVFLVTITDRLEDRLNSYRLIEQAVADARQG